MGDSFFDLPREQSLIKAAIVSKYLNAWATIMAKHAPKIAYVDLFCGPGRYADDTRSTPLLVLQEAIEKPVIGSRLVTVFNDKEPQHTDSLKTAIDALSGVSSLKYQPQIWTGEVGEETVKKFEGINLVPTLCFVDPFGYKGLSARLIDAVLKNWGCECVFLFNYNRINMGLPNPLVDDHMNALFSEDRAAPLRERLRHLSPPEREVEILQAISKALLEHEAQFVLPFCFKGRNGTRTSHYLIFVTKHFRGYDIMRSIMGRESSSSDQSVPTFQYAPARDDQQLLFEFLRPLSELKDMLLRDLAGETLAFEQLYERHSVGKPFLRRNYRAVLRELEEAGAITVESRKANRRKGTYAKHVRITFPKRGTHG